MHRAPPVGGVGVGVEHGQLDHAPLVQDPQASVEHVAYDLDPAVAQASWRLPQTTVHFDDVVGRDLAGLAYDETAVEVGLVGGEAQRSSLLPALSRRVASERFVGVSL